MQPALPSRPLKRLGFKGQQLLSLHPPAGGLAFLAAFLGTSWHFLLFPVLSGSLLLVLLTWAFSRWVP
jgi:CBS-domain-containing membrane protein